MTKTEMARVIVTALYRRPALVPATNIEVVRMVKRNTVSELAYRYKLALAAVESVRQRDAA